MVPGGAQDVQDAGTQEGVVDGVRRCHRVGGAWVGGAAAAVAAHGLCGSCRTIASLRKEPFEGCGVLW